MQEAYHKTASVLVVDDEPDLRELLRDALSETGAEIRVAASAEEALSLAGARRPDLLVTDLYLPDRTGLEVIDRLRDQCREDIPAVVITGFGDAAVFSEASRRRPVELMTKPLDLPRLKQAVRAELDRRWRSRQLAERQRRLRLLARKSNIQRREMAERLKSAGESLTGAYRALSGQMAMQELVLSYQQELLKARNDDDVFRTFFRLFVGRSGPVFGAALVCNADAELQIVGRFGVPYPDNVEFCRALSRPVIEAVIGSPQCALLDAGEKQELFEESIRRYLPGISILAVPLIPSPGELIGLVVLYRKAEQPFVDRDVALAELIATPTAVAVRRND